MSVRVQSTNGELSRSTRHFVFPATVASILPALDGVGSDGMSKPGGGNVDKNRRCLRKAHSPPAIMNETSFLSPKDEKKNWISGEIHPPLTHRTYYHFGVARKAC